MTDSKYIKFLTEQVQFVNMTELDPSLVPETIIEALSEKPEKTSVTLIWSETVTGELVTQLKRIRAKNLILIVNESTPSLRRAEMLINSNISRIYSFTNQEVTLDAIYRICAGSVIKEEKKREPGIRRILKLMENNGEQNLPVFLSLFADGVLIEHISNSTVASLQLKGKRASALYLETADKDHLTNLDRIISKDMGSQVLMNQHHLSEKDRQNMAEFSKRFKIIDSANQDDLIRTCSEITLPTLQNNVWEGPEVQLNTRINLIMKKPETEERFISIQGFGDHKSEPHLSIETAREVVESTDPSPKPKLLKYKKEIISKPFILLNARQRGIHEELLRLLYCVSTIPQVVLAVGPRSSYSFLMETAGEYERNSFYAHRSVQIVFTNKEKLPLLLKDLVHSAKFMEEEAEMISFQMAQEIMSLQEACDTMVGSIQSEYPQLFKAIDIESDQSREFIFKNLLKKHNGIPDPIEIFKNDKERKALHVYLTRVTPAASKTAFPDNIDDLVTTIQSLLFLILEKPKQKLKKNKVVFDFINQNKLKLIPLSAHVQDLEKLLGQLKNDFNSFPKDQLKATKTKVMEAIQHIEYVIKQIQLQFSFLQLATPIPTEFQDFHPESLHDPALLKDVAPYKQLQVLYKKVEAFAE